MDLNLLYVLGEHVDLGLCELSCADLLFEEHVKLGESATAGLRYTEVGVDDAQEATAGPEETGVVAPGPCAWVEHVGSQHTADNANNVVQVASKNDGLDLQAAGRDFGDEGVADSSNRQLVAQSPDQHHRAGSERCRILVGVGNKSEEAHDEKHGAEATETNQVESSATNADAHQEPRAEHTSHVDAVLSNCEIHSLAGVEASRLQQPVGDDLRAGLRRTNRSLSPILSG